AQGQPGEFLPDFIGNEMAGGAQMMQQGGGQGSGPDARLQNLGAGMKVGLEQDEAQIFGEQNLGAPRQAQQVIFQGRPEADELAPQVGGHPGAVAQADDGVVFDQSAFLGLEGGARPQIDFIYPVG